PASEPQPERQPGREHDERSDCEKWGRVGASGRPGYQGDRDEGRHTLGPGQPQESLRDHFPQLREMTAVTAPMAMKSPATMCVSGASFHIEMPATITSSEKMKNTRAAMRSPRAAIPCLSACCMSLRVGMRRRR